MTAPSPALSPLPSSPDVTVRGWCPSLHEPMRSGDGWLVRVKPRRAILTAGAARLVAGLAERHGNGRIELTNRGNLQLRGIAEAGLAPLAGALAGAGLADADPGVERRRNLLCPPLLGHDPALDPRLPGLIAALEAVQADPALEALPGKFGLALDGGGVLPLDASRADILLRAEGEALRLCLDGGADTALCPWGEAAPAIARLLRRFAAACGGAGAPKRLRELVRREGAAALLREAGLVPRTAPPAPAAGARPGFLPLAPGRGAARGAFLLGLPLGHLTAPRLAALAGLAERHGDATLRLTPWRLLVIPGVAARDASHLAGAVARAGGIADAGDPLLRIRACPGLRGCASASVDTEADAAALTTLLAGRGLPRAGLLHLSGCAKGCAHPGPAAVTLVGEAGGYGIRRDATAREAPERRGLSIAEVADWLLGAQDGAAPGAAQGTG
ncbi:precorrin-3B synthase [Roseomonas gilardii subsp. gilardii]|uniref:precorrin-3B synthase n=1 Tax=Roseomonas gilardii TaxID=257708 RepID=UPI001FF757EA|nr:precorrin-3B synthase [Roseomonas gilardii]UPG71222.1 precorrin-3B synthase [Roseomonas gilardii subsp. gilardii]